MSSPLTLLAEGIREGDELSGDGRDDSLVGLPGLSETLGEVFEARVVMSGNQCRLEHNVPHSPTPSRDGPFSAEGSAVIGDRSQACERGRLHTADHTELGHLGDQDCAGYGTDPRDRAQNAGGLCQILIAGYHRTDRVFEFPYPQVETGFEIGVDVVERLSRAKFLVRADLGQQALAHLDQLGSLRGQRSENPQLFGRKAAPCIGPEGQEASDELCIDPVGLGPRATALRKCLHLSGRHLPRDDAFRVEPCPELPLLTAGRLEATVIF